MLTGSLRGAGLPCPPGSAARHDSSPRNILVTPRSAQPPSSPWRKSESDRSWMVGSVVSEHGNGKEEEATAGRDVGCDEGPAEEPGPSLLPAAEPDPGREQLRRFRGGC